MNSKGCLPTVIGSVIVGNSRTMIYHTPDQHGYRMNSANAVYFNSKVGSQVARYRKALR